VDIAWLWHCHRLAPQRYESFCQHRFGGIVDPLPAFLFQTEKNQDEITSILWAKAFPQEPLFTPRTAADVGDDIPLTRDLDELVDGFDLLQSCSAQSGFLWQVSGPKFQEDEFLIKGIENYRKFLTLSQGDLPLVPTYQIDLIWHTHMLASVSNYNLDCLSIRGSKFYHDDSLNDRTAGAKLDVSFQDTCRRWEEAYGEAYLVPGAMYRGEPDPAYYCNYATWSPYSTTTSLAVEEFSPIPSTNIIMGGATSTGSSNHNTLQHWTAPSERDGSFIRAAPREATTNANPQIPGYVFGKGSKGDGYYSFSTKDAYDICRLRLAWRYWHEHKLYDNSISSNNCLWLKCCAPTESQIGETNKIKARMDDIGELLAIVRTRLKMSGPHDKITLVEAKLNGARGNNAQLASDAATETGQLVMYYYDAPPLALFVAAGCGGGQPAAGGGCGGGAACGASRTDRKEVNHGGYRGGYGGGYGGGGGCGGGGCGGGGCGGCGGGG
jgi:Glycine-rich domain-containing protein-like